MPAPDLDNPVVGTEEWLGSPVFHISMMGYGISNADHRRFEMPMIGSGVPFLSSWGSMVRRPKYGPLDVGGIVYLNDIVISEDGETAQVTLAGDKAVLDIIAEHEDVTVL